MNAAPSPSAPFLALHLGHLLARAVAGRTPQELDGPQRRAVEYAAQTNRLEDESWVGWLDDLMRGHDVFQFADDVKRLTNELATSRAQTAVFADRMETAERRAFELDGEVHHLLALRRQLESERDDWKAKAARWTESNAKLAKEYQHAAHTVERLTKERDEALKERSDAEHHIATLEARLEDSRRDNLALIEKSVARTSEMDELKGERDELKGELVYTRAELIRLRTEWHPAPLDDPSAPANDTATSGQAAKDAAELVKLERQLVLAELIEHGPSCASQIAARLGRVPNQIAARCWDLAKVKDGLAPWIEWRQQIGAPEPWSSDPHGYVVERTPSGRWGRVYFLTRDGANELIREHGSLEVAAKLFREGKVK